MKILFLPKWYPNHLDPLDGIFVREHALAVSKFDQVFVLYVHSKYSLKKRFEFHSVQHGNLRETSVWFNPPACGICIVDKLTTACFYLIAQLKGWRHVQRTWGRPDLVHVHVLCRTAPFAMYLKKRFGMPFIVSEHWTGFSRASQVKIPYLKRKLMRAILLTCDKVTTVTRHLEAGMMSTLDIKDQHKFHVISNTADGDTFYPVHAGDNDRSGVSIVHISTLGDKQKNFTMILEALSEVKRSRADMRLEVFGTGSELDKHTGKARELGLEGMVAFHGLQPKQVIANHLRSADFLLLFSNYETQSCVAIESILCGTPALTSDIGGVNEVIDSSNGLLVKPIEKRQLVRALQTMLRVSKRFDRQRIATDALIYDHIHVGKQFHDLYKCVVASPACYKK